VRYTDNSLKVDDIKLKMTSEELFCIEDQKLEKFDQFKDKQSTYDFKNYTSTLDESKVTK